jgi:hypothetical protein
MAEYLAEKDPAIFTGEPKRTYESWVRPKNPALPREETRWKIARAADISPELLGLEEDRTAKLRRIETQLAALLRAQAHEPQNRKMSEAQKAFASEMTQAGNLIRVATGALDDEEELFDATSNAVAAALAAIDAAIAAERGE